MSYGAVLMKKNATAMQKRLLPQFICTQSSTAQTFTCVDATLTQKKDLFVGIYYVGTVNGPTSIARLAVWKMYQKVASFSFLDTPPKQTLTIFWGV